MTPTSLRQMVSAIYCSPFGKVCLSSVYWGKRAYYKGPYSALFCLLPALHFFRSFGVHHHQFADDTPVYLALRSPDIQNGLALLGDRTAAVKQWYRLSREWTPAQYQQIGSYLPRYVITINYALLQTHSSLLLGYYVAS